MERPVYITIKNSAEEEYSEKKSRFIAYTRYTESEGEAQAFIDEIKKKDYEAKHHVYAYQMGLHDEFQRSSDDGEPAGTGGKPVMEIIKKSGIKNITIVVSRYFGGILLGAGPLARAYGKAAAMALTTSGKVKKIPAKQYNICFDYPFLGKIESFLLSRKIQVCKKSYTQKISFICLFPEMDSKIIQELCDLSCGNIDVLPLGGDEYMEDEFTE